MSENFQAGLVLHHAWVSTCSQRVRMALAEKGLAWTGIVIDLSRSEQVSPSYLEINPNGLVPTLVHNGRPVTDSSVIMEYLDDTFKDRQLRPQDPYELSRMRSWCAYIDEVPTPATRIPSFQKSFGRAMRQMPREAFERVANSRPLRKHMYLRMGQEGFSEDEVTAALEQIRQSIERLNSALAQGPWILGDRFSHADISLLPTLIRMIDLEYESLWAGMPRVTDWLERIQARFSFKLAYPEQARQL